jgi:hypothetical protein
LEDFTETFSKTFAYAQRLAKFGLKFKKKTPSHLPPLPEAVFLFRYIFLFLFKPNRTKKLRNESKKVKKTIHFE